MKFWNNGAVETYGFLKEEAFGKAIHELLRTKFPEPPDQIIAHLMRKGRWEGELTHTTSTGKEIVVESRWAQQTDKDGNLLGILEINRDITARKLAEEAPRANMARLELVNVFEDRIKEEGGEVEISTLPDIEADETRLLRLFQNLTGNSLKFRPDSVCPKLMEVKAEMEVGLCRKSLLSMIGNMLDSYIRRS